MDVAGMDLESASGQAAGTRRGHGHRDDRQRPAAPGNAIRSVRVESAPHHTETRKSIMRYILLLLLGIPLPIIILIALFA